MPDKKHSYSFSVLFIKLVIPHKKYIADGTIASSPKGFVQKTAYYIGCRIIEICMEKGIELDELCSFDSETIITKSGYFF